VELLLSRVEAQPHKTAYTFLRAGEAAESIWTYQELEQRARGVAARLQCAHGMGHRVLLLYPAGLEFIAGFWGCLYAGAIAVPAYPPKLNRHSLRLTTIVQDCDATIALTTRDTYLKVLPTIRDHERLQKMQWITTDDVENEGPAPWAQPHISPESIAFIQYTSGSTASPKGVIVTHRNLLENEELIRKTFQQNEQSIIAGWLPLYHDMGLIGNVLQPLYAGAHCILMSPVAFLQHPLRWLKAISDYRATTSGGPNFAYDLCTQKIPDSEAANLDLSSWEIAFNGAEPVRAETIERFSAKFASAGFRRKAFRPCYGLAEATLLVSASAPERPPTVLRLNAEKLEKNIVEEQPTGNTRTVVGCGAEYAGKIAIVDPESRIRAAEGQIGEIWVAGSSVARGYWNKPEETERVFAARTSDDEGPFLRTGDLGFLRHGELCVTGRLKDLIIIRGRNHYPQDIELTVETAHPDLRPGCGAAFCVEVDEEERLVIVHEVDRACKDSNAVNAAISEAIAQSHEVRAYAVVLIRAGSIPRTSSGKIQRFECRREFLEGRLKIIDEWRLDHSAGSETELIDAAVPGVNSLEDWLARRVAATEHAVSGERITLDSLSAIQLAHAVETELHVSIPFSRLLQAFSIGDLAAEIAGLQPLPEPEILHHEQIREFPLSEGQRSLWFLHQLDPEHAVYNLSFAFRISTQFGSAALKEKFQNLVSRHPSLRTTFHSNDAGLYQRVHDHMNVCFEEVDASEWPDSELRRERFAERSRVPFDLEKGPLFKVYVFRRGHTECFIYVSIHHLIVDLWSFGVLADELSLLLQEETGKPAELPRLDATYQQYVQWQHEMLSGPDEHRLFSYWQSQLSGTTWILNLPTDHPRPAVQRYRGGSRLFHLGRELSQKLKALCRSNGVTLFTLLMAAFQLLLHRYSQQEEIVVGTPVWGRKHSHWDRVVGYFVNLLPVRGFFPDNHLFADHLEQVKKAILQAFEHQEYPFLRLVERLQPGRDPSRSPLTQVMFAFQSTADRRSEGVASIALGYPETPVEMNGLVLQPVEFDRGIALFDLSLAMAESNESLFGIFEYSADLYVEETITRLMGHWEQLLRAIVNDPTAKGADFELLRPEEKDHILAISTATVRNYPDQKAIHEIFEEQVKRNPEAEAIIHKRQRLTYGQLNRKANEIAFYLLRLGVRPETRVGVCMDRTPDMIAALLGVLKAGGAYVPLDPAYPKERLAWIFEDSQAAVLLTEARLVEQFSDIAGAVVTLDGQLKAEAQSSNPNLIVLPENLAYVIYTSGSTGKPKGVGISHTSVATLLHWAREVFSDEDLSGILASTSICFDLSVFEIFVPLGWGGRLVLVNDALELAGTGSSDAVALVNTVPSAIREVARMKAIPPKAQTINLAGEPLTEQLVEQIREAGPHVRIFNLYGPSEDTTYSTCACVAEPGSRTAVSIGRPVANTQAYVLDREMRLLPLGIPGELYLGGAGLARGYVNRGDLTAERFVPDPFCAGEPGGRRLYRTGDKVRWSRNRNLEFMGRFDHQVKLRGFRIELGEIEAVLENHPQIEQAVAVVREDTPGEERLVAYVVQKKAAPAVSKDELRAHLRRQLPEYMVPVLVMLDVMPLTPNGKLDRKKLPAIKAEEGHFVAPRTQVEEIVSGIWSEVLGTEATGIFDNFFDAGGHSLLATRVISRIKTVFGVELPLRTLFEAPTISDLAQQVGRAHGQQISNLPLKRIPREGDLPLSYAQQRMWFLQQLEAESPAYNMPFGVQLSGNLNREALEWSLNELVKRHEVLRTSFPAKQGEPVARIAAELRLEVEYSDLWYLSATESTDEARKRMREEAARPFDLARAPLLRAKLLQTGMQEHMLLVVMHHIVSDGWSSGILMREFAQLYRSRISAEEPGLPDLKIQYADFAAWQREWLQGEVLDRQLEYWQRQLAGLEPLDLLTDHARPPVMSWRGGTVRASLGRELSEKLKRFSRQQNVTLFMSLLAAFQVVLGKYSGQHDIAIGTVVANRNHLEVEELIGFFVNTLVLRTDSTGNPNFREMLSRICKVTLDAYQHQDLPFEKLVAELHQERDWSRAPLFQVMLVLQNFQQQELQLPGLRLSNFVVDHDSARFDVLLMMNESADGLAAELSYARDLYEADTMERLLRHTQLVLEQMTVNPGQKIQNLSLLTGPEREQVLLHWNQTYARYPNRCVHELFEEQAAQTPKRVAVEFQGEQLSYADLNQRANQLAHYLKSMGVGPETRVGICLERSLNMAIALLGILKAGAAYVPLDASYPRQRLEYMVRDSEIELLISHGKVLPSATGKQLRCIELARDKEMIAQQDNENLPVSTDAGNLAYVMYTSGSTGVPKGVAVEHRSIVRLVKQTNFIDFQEQDTALHLAPISFDASTFEIWGTLLNGGRLVMYPPQPPTLEQLGEYIQQSDITVLWLTAGLFHQMVEGPVEKLRGVRQLLAGGDVLNAAQVKRAAMALPATTIINGYGPTENTTFTCCYRIDEQAVAQIKENVPIGRPISNTEVYVLDEAYQPAPIGVAGELYIAGDGLARGYLNQPAHTAEKFIPNVFSTSEGERLYRTGDRVRWRDDGNLEFLGRLDCQVKVRGFRIEVEEIEAILLEHKSIEQAVVVVHEEEDSDKRLVAYVVLRNGSEGPGNEQLRSYLSLRLPDYMVPNAFVKLEQLPLTVNGKVDRRKLPRPEAAIEGLEYTAPRDQLEEELCSIWKRLLKADRVGIHDRFFELGGHSLLATRLISSVHETFHVAIEVRSLFQGLTVEEMAQIIRESATIDQTEPEFISIPRDIHRIELDLGETAAATQLSEK
jgi:amino acid adenylation domain-containing protein